jgi:hypothetical protein
MSEEGNNHEAVLRRAAENTELSLALRRACQAALRSDLAVRAAHDWLALDARVSALRQALDEASSKIKAAEAEREGLVHKSQLLLRVMREINCRIEHGATSNGHLEGILRLIEANLVPTEAKRGSWVPVSQPPWEPIPELPKEVKS